MSDQEFIIAPATIEVDFTILPTETILNSMMILNQVEELSGLGEWVEKTYEALTPEQRHDNLLVLHHLLDGCCPEETPDNFPDYLEAVRTAEADDAPTRIIEGLVKRCAEHNLQPEVNVEDLIADKNLYLATVERIYKDVYVQKGHTLDLELYAEVHDMLQNPTAMKQRVVDHLTFMWQEHLKDEWKRTLPLLRETVDAFKQIDFSSHNVLEAIRAVTGRDMSEYWAEGELKARRVMFAPTAHIGPYIAYFTREDTMYIIFGARMPRGVRVASPALSRSELLVRLSALADDTRLTILELLTQHQELCAQDIIEILNLSQSSASRHLRQLTATGYLVERRRDVAKCYSLNMDRMDDTMRALKHFLAG